MNISSVPNISQFNPHDVPFQYQVINDINTKFDYSKGVHQVLLSGSVGSAKSILMAHAICFHALRYPGANIGIGRKTKPALKTTLIDKILKHLSGLEQWFEYNKSTGNFEFANGSKITAYSWGDTDWQKVRSEEFSFFAIEELSENDDKEFYYEILMRLGRLRHIVCRGFPMAVLMSATNPDEPDHWIYKEIIEPFNQGNELIHVYYSKTAENKFLPPSYIAMLRDQLDDLQVQRFLEGKWISIRGQHIYYNYEESRNFRNEDYLLDTSRPINIGFDFNIGCNKPLSCVFSQFDEVRECFHVFDEVIVQGADTESILFEMANRGLLDLHTRYEINGDATGRARHTASKRSDYDVISRFLDNYRTKENRAIQWTMEVPLANPPIRTRHNELNNLFKSSTGRVRLWVYRNCKTLNEGLRLCKLLDGGKYLEDDSKPYQHCTTSLGYTVISVLRRHRQGVSETIQL